MKNGNTEYSTALSVAAKLPERPMNANKGTFGKVLVIAGSQSYPGAAYLSATSATRTGAGLVTLATIQVVYSVVARKLLHATFLVLPKSDGGVGPEAIEPILEKLPSYDVLLIGPGLGQEEQTIEFVEKFLIELKKRKDLKKLKIVVDADGLNSFSKIKNWWDFENPGVVTPHPGEMSRLTGLSVEDVQSDRIEVARTYAKKWKKVVVLKGAETVIARVDGKVVLNPFSNAVLATAGTGDVLGGAIAGLLAQGLSLYDACLVGCYIHGLAGDLVDKNIGDTGVLATDLLYYLPKAIKALKGR